MLAAPRLLASLAAAALLAITGCRRQRTPEVPEVWDEDAAPERTEALGNLAPPWPAPSRAQLDDGLLTFWMHEDGTPALHLRLLLPTGGDLSSEDVAVCAELIRAELRRQLARRGIQIEIEHRAGRIEVAIHGRDADRGVVFNALARALGADDPQKGLAAARDRLRKNVDPARTDELAAAALVGQLLPGRRADHVDPRALAKTTPASLARRWAELVDPRRAVLVVHAGHPAGEARSSLAVLSSRWEGKGRRRAPGSALARLRSPSRSVGGTDGRNLMTDASAPLTVIETRAPGGPVLVMGRKIPTPRASDRSLARLSQRLAQEELDVRLSIAGEEALLLVVVPLTGRQADATAQKTVEQLQRIAKARQPRQRLFQAAQLWLGARVVEASLRGEDWTGLWSESVDLASDDAGIATALAKDAEVMLSVDPEQVTQWQQQWFDPRGGKPGWGWIVVGADRKLQRQLSRLAKVVVVDGPGAAKP